MSAIPRHRGEANGTVCYVPDFYCCDAQILKRVPQSLPDYSYV